MIILLSIMIIVIAIIGYSIYKKNKDNLEKSKHYIVLSILICIALYLFVILLYQPFSGNFSSFSYLINESPSWVDIWLNIFSITISTVTALIAIRISKLQKSKEDFLFYSSLEFTPISDSLAVEEINNNIELTELSKIVKSEKFPTKGNKIQFDLNTHFNPEIQYELITFKIKNTSQDQDWVVFNKKEKNIIFEYYALDGKTSFEIILLSYDEALDNVFAPIIYPETFFPFSGMNTYEIQLDFALKSYNNYDFISGKTYQINMSLKVKDVLNINNGSLFYKYFITKSKSKL